MFASQQTALDLLSDGWSVLVAVDAVGSRFEIDYQNRLAADGFGRRYTNYHRSRAFRVVPSCRHAGIQANQPACARACA